MLQPASLPIISYSEVIIHYSVRKENCCLAHSELGYFTSSILFLSYFEHQGYLDIAQPLLCRTLQTKNCYYPPVLTMYQTHTLANGLAVGKGYCGPG